MDHELKIAFRLSNELGLRTFRENDAPGVFACVMKNCEHLRPWVHWMVPQYSLESAKTFIAESVAAANEKRSLGCGIFRNEDFVGSIGFVKFDWKAKKAEIGYWISRDEEGNGTVSKACKALIEYAFGELGLNRIEIRCSAENIRSAAIPERLGFLKEGVLRQSEFRNGRLHDFNYYGLLAADRDHQA